MNMTQEQKDKLLYGEPKPHDMDACNALKEYEELCKPFDAMQELQRRGEIRRNTAALPNMAAIARKYNTTVQAMKEHRPCIEK
jgi:hypothetical protein